jgi:hypothetical protein
MDRKKNRLTKDIAHVLSSCPGLKLLGLGMNCDFDAENYPETFILETDSYFLEKLCSQYGARSSTSPLTLETLRLGTDLWLRKSRPQNGTNFLTKLLDLSRLEKLHIFNSLVKDEGDDEETRVMTPDWSQLAGCTSLRQLSVSRLEADVEMWLNEGKRVQELIVTDHRSMHDHTANREFDALALPHLTMLFTREITVDRRSGNNYVYTRTVLDKLKDGGSQLERLSLSLDFETQWVMTSSNNFFQGLTIVGTILL